MHASIRLLSFGAVLGNPDKKEGLREPGRKIMPEEPKRTSRCAVMGEKANTFNQRRSADDPVLWIARVGLRKLNRPNRDLLSDWEDLHV